MDQSTVNSDSEGDGDSEGDSESDSKWQQVTGLSAGSSCLHMCAMEQNMERGTLSRVYSVLTECSGTPSTCTTVEL